MKKIGYIFWGLAGVLFVIMWVVVIFNYRKMKWGIENEGYSAPASVAFVYAVPFLIGIVICAVIAYKTQNL